jgi:hypothetical protein
MNTNSASKRHGQDQLIPFLWIRRGIGILGILFPFVLWFGAKLWGDCPNFQPSISDYYHTNMRDVFVGFLWVIAVFLFTYRGPDKADNLSTNLAALMAIGVSLFPTSLKSDSTCHICMTVFTCQPVHLVCAVAFFLIKAYISHQLFPKLEEGRIYTEGKRIRNRIYKTCAYVMLASMLVIFLYFIFDDKLPAWLADAPIIFIFEWVALWAFGFAWITKGEWFLQNNTPVKNDEL